MNRTLTTEIIQELRHILATDRACEVPVVSAVSLGFWEQAKQWVHHIAMTPVPFTVALSGGSGSGKSRVREMLVTALGEVAPVSSFTQDNYYRDFAADFPHWPLDEFYHRIDFDDPAHIRFEELVADLTHLKTLRFGQTLYLPQLVYGTPQAKPTRIARGLAVPVTPFIVTEGIHAFHSPQLRGLYDFKIYVDVTEAERRARWIARNQRDNRGTTDNMWQTTVTCLERHILPNRAHADLVLNNMAPPEQIAGFVQTVIRLLSHAAQRVA